MGERTYLTEDVRDAVAALLPKVIREIAESRTSVAHLDTETVRSLARAEARAVGDEAQKECVENGPICGVWEEIGKMRAQIGSMEKSLAEERGAAREAQTKNLRNVQIFTVLAALSTIASFVISHWPHK